MTGESVFDELRKDHEVVLDGVRALIAEVERVEAGGDAATREQVERCRERLRSLRRAFTAHRCREEIGLFPEVEQVVSEGAPSVDILGSFFAGEAEDDIIAHVEIARELQQLDLSLERMLEGEQEGPALAEVARGLADLLIRHATKEDTEIFPMMARTLTDKQLSNVAARMAELCETGSERAT